MMPAEQWYEYQKVYKKHGINMKPKTEKMKKLKKETADMSLREKITWITLLLVAGLLLVSIVELSNHSDNFQYSINKMEKENMSLLSEIENLNIELNKANNIEIIEKKAEVDLGMIKAKTFEYIEEEKPISKEFAMLLRREAHN